MPVNPCQNAQNRSEGRLIPRFSLSIVPVTDGRVFGLRDGMTANRRHVGKHRNAQTLEWSLRSSKTITGGTCPWSQA